MYLLYNNLSSKQKSFLNIFEKKNSPDMSTDSNLFSLILLYSLKILYQTTFKAFHYGQ